MEDNQPELKLIISQWLNQVDQGDLSHVELLERLRQLDTGENWSHYIDLDRARRCGFPEAVYGPGKSLTDLVEIIHRLRAEDHPVLVTRLEQETGRQLVGKFPEAQFNEVACTLRISRSNRVRSAPNRPPTDASKRSSELEQDRSPKPSPSPPLDKPAANTVNSTFDVAVVTAGTTDRSVAEEAVETLKWMDVDVQLFQDLGVAGPDRIRSRISEIRQAKVVIVVAGMEGALPSVVGGYLSCPVIAVPTSVGYGAAFGGIAALLGMLNSCAANTVVVNIDAGFKAGHVAGMIVSQSRSDA